METLGEETTPIYKHEVSIRIYNFKKTNSSDAHAATWPGEDLHRHHQCSQSPHLEQDPPQSEKDEIHACHHDALIFHEKAWYWHYFYSNSLKHLLVWDVKSPERFLDCSKMLSSNIYINMKFYKLRRIMKNIQYIISTVYCHPYILSSLDSKSHWWVLRCPAIDAFTRITGSITSNRFVFGSVGNSSLLARLGSMKLCSTGGVGMVVSVW